MNDVTTPSGNTLLKGVRPHTTHHACDERLKEYGSKTIGCCCTGHRCKTVATPSRDEPQQGLRALLKAELSRNYYRGLDKKGWTQHEENTAIDSIIALIEQTLHDCLPKRPTIDTSQPMVGSYTNGIKIGKQQAIDQTQANFKRRIEKL